MGPDETVWDAGLITCALLSKCKERQTGETDLERALRETLSRDGHVLELGTGIGMVGKCFDLVFGKHNVQVTLTDLSSAGPLILKNIDRPLTRRKRQKIDRERLTFEALDWTEPVPESLTGKVDTIIMTDVTYNETYHDALQKTLDGLSKAPDCRILFASKYRHASERPFIESLKKRYRIMASAVYDGSTFECTSEDPSIGDVEVLLLSCI